MLFEIVPTGWDYEGGYNSPMDALPLEPPKWIATPLAFQKMVRDISNEPRLAVDTESNSLFAYKEKVCLVQISTPSTDYLIDPIVIHDLSALGPIFANPQLEKIFHASEYDIICLKRDFSFQFSNIFDTMIAARILGKPEIGLGSLLLIEFNISMDKRYQRANWGIRPLSRVMLDYARMDTHMLFALREKLERDLVDRHLRELAAEDFTLACDVSSQLNDLNIHPCWKVAGSHNLTPRQAAVLDALCDFRDRQARQMDVPLFKVLSNDLLLELSLEPPHSSEELKKRPGMSEKMFARFGMGILKSIETGEIAPPPTRIRRPRPDEKYLQRLDALREWRKIKAKELKVESDIILPRDAMEKIAGQHPHNLNVLQTTMAANPWRFEHYGKAILTLLEKLETS